MINHAWLESVFENALLRFGAGVFFLARAWGYRLLGREFRSLTDFCWVVRVSNIPFLQRIARRHVFAAIESIRRGPGNPVLDAFRADPESAALAASYTLSGGGPHELFRDVIVLKKASDSEKGVILLKYARTFSAIAALLDLTRLMDRYTLVLEPCWAGYCDTGILLLMKPGHPLLVQCFTEDDYRYVASVGAPLIPLHLGPADWVDADIFSVEPVARKTYDLVMVANWAARKRHALLFRALRDIKDRDVRVLLVGFAWYNRTADDIRREAREYQNDRVQIEIIEKVPQSQLAQYLSQCNAFVFLSRKEGDNKALVEAMFADVPAIVYDKTQGGASSRINASTGVFSSEQELTQKIRYMLDNRASFSPRKWAFANTGSAVSTKVLDAALKQAVTGSGGLYAEGIVEKTNAPNLAYKDASRREQFKEDYDFVSACRRVAPQTPQS